MIRLLNFADERMTRSQMDCTQSAYKNGVDEVHQYATNNIDHYFYELNKEVLSSDRGAGYWLWKPYCIWRSLLRSKDGDILIYMDSGVKLIAPVKNIIDVMDEDLFLFSNGHQHVHWCKMDVLNGILKDESDGVEWRNDKKRLQYQQAQASVIFIRVSPFSRKFIKEWLLWCQMPGFIDDSPSVLPNHPEFAEHRHDQAILTCMAIKYGIKLHWWADRLWYESQRYRWPDDKYPSMFEHHRKRDNEYK